jgi:delta 1-pyrroline-5-carboxylate dehydrogenase
MNSSELKIKNAQYRQQMIEKICTSVALRTTDLVKPALSDVITAELAYAVVEVGNTLSEQICELREAVDRLTSSLSKTPAPNQPETKNEVEP